MELVSVELDAPIAGWVRTTGTLRRGDGAAEAIWFEVEERHADALTTTAEPWLAAGIAGAIHDRAPFVSRVPLDAQLHDNMRECALIWRTWDPSQAPVAIECDVVGPARAARTSERTASFFSGGVDSFYTALAERAAPIDDLFLVHGLLDVPLRDARRFARVRAHLSPVADALGKTLVVMRTNVFESSLWRTRARHSFGAIMGSTALALQRRWSRVLIPSSLHLDWLDAYGSHPLTHALLSTTHTRFVDDHIAPSRFDKTAAVARSEVALRALRVCPERHDADNCLRCEKCIRTLVALELVGARERASGFAGPLDLRAIAAVAMADEFERYYIEQLLVIARARRRWDLTAALCAGLVRSRAKELARRLRDGR